MTNMKQIMQAVGVLSKNTDQFRNRLCKYKNLKKKKSLCFVYSLPSIVLAAPPPCCMWQKSRNNKMAEKLISRNPITYDTLKFYSNETLIICKLFLSRSSSQVMDTLADTTFLEIMTTDPLNS